MISSRVLVVCGLFLIANTNLPILSADDGATIDRMLTQTHQDAGVRVTALCDDATFLRRLSLDLIGRVPTVSELKDFLAEPDRVAAIENLLASDEHPRFWSHLWTTMLVGRSLRQEVETEVLRAWIEDQLRDEVAINQLVFELITAEGVTSLVGPVNYVVANRRDPVMRLSRAFLSVQLDCAQCHDHPHDRWTHEDYAAMQRFFRPTRYREVSGGVAVSDGAGDAGPNGPVFLTGRKPHTAAWRRELGLMVVQSKPFSRAMVNRAWHWLMGRGLIDPVDGLARDNPAVAPLLLEQLATDFRDDRFQLRPLIRRICRSDAYQRQPVVEDTQESENQLRLFAARNVRRQLPEQWIASLAIVLDRPTPSAAEVTEQSRRLLGANRQDSPTSDPFDWSATSQTLIRQLAGPTPPPLRRLDAIFLATLARRPTDDERRRVQQERTQDILFALVHSNEFLMND